MALIDAGLRGALIALLALVIAALWPQWRHARHADVVRLGMALCLSLIVQTLSSAPWVERELACAPQAPAVGVSLGTSVVFWLFARAVFQDGFRLRPWHAALWALVALYGASVCLWQAWWAGWVVMRAIPVTFALLGLAAVVGPWRVDLVEARRRLRGLVVGGGAGYALALVALRTGSGGGGLSDTAALVDVSLLLVLTALIARRLLVPRAHTLWGEAEPALLPVAAVPAAEAPAATDGEAVADSQDARLAAALATLMGEARGYAQEGLSLASLAEQLGTPEYRLRRVINQRLGHRNFNAYVNGLRLAEAKRRLADPAQRQLPVLSLALDVGFGSIGPFNRAFKADTGLTPTEFRQQALADS